MLNRLIIDNSMVFSAVRGCIRSKGRILSRISYSSSDDILLYG